MTNTNQQTAELERVLHECSAASLEALGRTRNMKREIELEIAALSTEMADIRRPRKSKRARVAQQSTDKIIDLLEASQRTLAASGKMLGTELAKSFSVLERDAESVTITLFGRTRTGKSTLLEALMRGGGSAIGRGRQHTTREVSEYWWPPESRLLRIVDTPGVEGLEGAKLAAMAEKFVERSDHIFFVLSNDAATSGELEYFRNISTKGKSVTCILNIKEMDIDVLLEAPEYVFREDELDGHRRRICRYLEQNVGLDEIPILPVHAHAAWLATHDGDPLRREQLRVASRIEVVEAAIIDFTLRSALAARVASPRHLLGSFLQTASGQLIDGVRPAIDVERDVISSRTATAATIARLRARSSRLLDDAVQPFEEVANEVPAMVDSIIADKTGGSELSTRVGKLMKRHSVDNSAKRFEATLRLELTKALDEQVKVASFEASHGIDLNKAENALARVNSLREAESTERWKRVSVRAGAGTAASALAGWAVLNWWNPSGWVAGLAAAGVAAVGIGAQAVAKKVTNNWSAAKARELSDQRECTIDGVRAAILNKKKTQRVKLQAWSDAFFREAEANILGSLDEVLKVIGAFKRCATQGVSRLDSLRGRLDHDLVNHAVRLAVPEVASGDIQVTRIARFQGIGTKVEVARVRRSPGTVLGACIGRKGDRVRAMRMMLGGEQLAFVDRDLDVKSRVAAALSPARVDSAAVESSKRGSSFLLVRVPASEAHIAIGRQGANVRLAQEITGTHIEVVPKSANLC